MCPSDFTSIGDQSKAPPAPPVEGESIGHIVLKSAADGVIFLALLTLAIVLGVAVTP